MLLNASAAPPVSVRTPEGVRAEPSLPSGQARSTSKPDARRESLALCRASAEAGVRHGTLPRMAARTRSSSQRASLEPEPKRGNERFLGALTSAEAEISTPKLPFRRLTAEAVNALWGSSGNRVFVPSPKRRSSHRPPEGCLPPASHRGGTQAQDTQRESDDVSLGVRLLSAYEPGRSLCRFTSPTPSALRVSHSLSGLSPPGPRGFVSRHIRP
jgi:hypothetical protein